MSEKIGSEFMKKTRYAEMPPSEESQGLPQPPLQISPVEGAILIDLPAPAEIECPSVDLRKAIEQRRSVRHYDPQPLTLEEFSLLLWLTQGVKKVTKRPATFRNVPSAGSRHAFETYLAVNRVTGIEPGLYRYLAIEHQLLEVKLDPGFSACLADACGGQPQLVTCAATFLWVAVRERMTWRYGERGYRYLHLDAGHICQNLYLAAEALQCGVCAIGAYEDDQINQLLGLDGVEQFLGYAATLGKKGT